MVVRQTSVLPHSMSFEIALFSGYAIDVHRTVAALGSDVFVEGVPSDALHVVTVLSNLVNAFTCNDRESTDIMFRGRI